MTKFAALSVKLLVGDEQSLFVMLGSDGSISRVGTGSVENVERDMFIGKASPEVFQGLRAKVAPGATRAGAAAGCPTRIRRGSFAS